MYIINIVTLLESLCWTIEIQKNMLRKCREVLQAFIKYYIFSPLKFSNKWERFMHILKRLYKCICFVFLSEILVQSSGGMLAFKSRFIPSYLSLLCDVKREKMSFKCWVFGFLVYAFSLYVWVWPDFRRWQDHENRRKNMQYCFINVIVLFWRDITRYLTYFDIYKRNSICKALDFICLMSLYLRLI